MEKILLRRFAHTVCALFLASTIGWSQTPERVTIPDLPDPIVQVQAKKEEESKKDSQTPAAKKDAPRRPRFDPALVSAGQAAFSANCTKCHDASRALEKTKDLAGWQSTVSRMANKPGADIPSSSINAIATYLASRNQGEADSGEATGNGSGGEGESGSTPSMPTTRGGQSNFSAFATLSPLWRGGGSHVQNPGFFPEAWIGGTWQGGRVLSARVTACTSCHGVNESGFISRLELLEGVVRADVSQWVDPFQIGVKGAIEAGRFIVPFGAFASQTNPSLFRTVSKPLIFNMGQRVDSAELGQAVLPMPYADEGVLASLEIPLTEVGRYMLTTTMDVYAINGLSGNERGINWVQSRDYIDNNGSPSWGGRATVGIPIVRAGASVTGGRFNIPGSVSTSSSTTTTDIYGASTTTSGTSTVSVGKLDYLIYGFDIQARYENLFRFQFEYARRSNDRFDTVGSSSFEFTEIVDGYYFETELRPFEESPVSLVGRYDRQRRRSSLPPLGASGLYGPSFLTQRFTWGVNINLWRQSLLMINHERWFVPGPAADLDVLGVRYVITF